MAVTRRGYIFCAFLSSVLCVLLVVVALASDSWRKTVRGWIQRYKATGDEKCDRQGPRPIAYTNESEQHRNIVDVYSVAPFKTWELMWNSAACFNMVSGMKIGLQKVTSTATAPIQADDSTIRYGLFRGELTIRELITPSINTLYMTCVPKLGACALSCKTNELAREIEVRALAEGLRPNPACIGNTNVNITNPLSTPPVISFAFYVSFLVLFILQLVLAVVSACLAILNATKNPTETAFGLPGCLWTNVAAALVGVAVMLMFGIYYLTSGLKDHLALTHIALGLFVPGPGLGYSYWLLIVACLCSATNVVLIQVRAYLLERDPPPPTIKVENHSDGTIFLY